MMRDDMALPAVQRDALVAPMRRVIAGYNVSQDERWTGTTNWQKADRFARAALAAIEEQYVLIPKDQVETTTRYIVVDKNGNAGPVLLSPAVARQFAAQLDADHSRVAPHRIEQRTVITATTPWTTTKEQ